MIAVLMSIRPKWCSLIASGKKTLELRKTKPKFNTPFKVYVYCTANKNGTKDLLEIHSSDGKIRKANSKVIGEFVCDYIENYKKVEYETDVLLRHIKLNACIDYDEIYKYLGYEKRGYGWHISDLVIYDKPRELSEFYIRDKTYDNSFCWAFEDRPKLRCLTRPPQSWCYVSSQTEKGGAKE